MKRYLLDANIIIDFWKNYYKTLEKLLKEERIVILKEVLDELAIKETKIYRRREVLSERFCNLLVYSLEVEKENLSGFYMVFDYQVKEKFESNNLSQNDLMQLYCCYIDNNLILVTEDRQLYEVGKHILGEKRVILMREFIEKIIW